MTALLGFRAIHSTGVRCPSCVSFSSVATNDEPRAHRIFRTSLLRAMAIAFGSTCVLTATTRDGSSFVANAVTTATVSFFPVAVDAEELDDAVTVLNVDAVA